MSNTISAIILDLGGVLLNIDYHRTEQAFRNFGIERFGEIYSQARQTSLFDDFERGKIDTDTFRNRLREISGIQLNNEEIDSAWNAMLLDFPESRIEFLEELSEKYPLYLLSNTNAIHVKAFEEHLNTIGQLNRIQACFNGWYYSSDIGYNKPDPKAFLKVCEMNGLDPSSTLFIDDTERHVEGAKQAGLQAFYLDVKKLSVEEFLPNILTEFN